MKNQKDRLSLPATDSMPEPGDFPLHSVESRAAARRKVQRSLEATIRTTCLLIGFPPGKNGRKKADIGSWHEHKDGSLTRNVIAPAKMSKEDALEIFGTKTNPLDGQMGLFGIHH